MSATPETPTPETDKWDIEVYDGNGQSYHADLVPKDFARKLERERDQWREVAGVLARSSGEMFSPLRPEWRETSKKVKAALAAYDKLNVSVSYDAERR